MNACSSDIAVFFPLLFTYPHMGFQLLDILCLVYFWFHSFVWFVWFIKSCLKYILKVVSISELIWKTLNKNVSCQTLDIHPDKIHSQLIMHVLQTRFNLYSFFFFFFIRMASIPTVHYWLLEKSVPWHWTCQFFTY